MSLKATPTPGRVRSGSSGGWNLGFKLLDDQKIAKVAKEVAQLEVIANLSAAAKAIALAEIYRHYYLFAEAIDILQTLINSGWSYILPRKMFLMFRSIRKFERYCGLDQVPMFMVRSCM